MQDSSAHPASKPLQVGEAGILQHLRRQALNGLVAEVTGELKTRMLYNLSDPADSEICPAYRVRVPGYPSINDRIEWCVKAHQLRRITGFDRADADMLDERMTDIVKDNATEKVC